ncbi:endonuclease/exonuclease/phosphatase family protein [Arthrobacter sp. NPDC058127]|uniref:endonuclease/exonuclease/phosphatase family protein n=1 Tax=Arthrobacter sp. NPDC058127 TaxID=3346351 RepID=UPI0036E0B992
MVAGDHPFAAWTGSRLNKGLGVLGYADARYRITEQSDAGLPWHIPFTVNGLNIIALWAHQLTRDLRYVRVTHEIVDRHKDFLGQGRALLMGDFNSNTIWDRGHPDRNHSMLVEKLGKLGLCSAFHSQTRSAHGAEQTKTYFHTRNLRFGHHIDYAFVRESAKTSLEVGSPDEWLAHSDHMPLILDIAEA